MQFQFNISLKKVAVSLLNSGLVFLVINSAFGFNIYYENNSRILFKSSPPENTLMTKVTFQVDMRDETVDPQGVYFASNFQDQIGGSNWTPIPMCDLGTGIWSITICDLSASPNPITDQYKFLNGIGGWEFTGFGGPCTNAADNNNRYVDITGSSQTVGPFCFSSCDMFCSGMGDPGGSDNTPPVILDVPFNTTIICGDPLPDGNPLLAEDECDVNCTLETDNPIDDTSQLNACGLGQIFRTWEVTDCAGNTTTETQIITVVDDASGTCTCDASCTTTRPCEDGDPCTIGEEETVGFDGTICTPCAGGVVGGCDPSCLTTRNCDDGDPCTEGEYEEVGPDGSICYPCGDGIPNNNCDAPCSYDLPCDDGNPCTTGEFEVYAPDGSICTPCSGGVVGGCDPACLETIVFTNASPFCKTADTLQLNAMPAGGTWSGDVDSLGQFIPDSLGADTFRAVYSFVNPANCVIVDSTEFIILPTPKIAFGDTTFCLSTNIDTLIATPSGGKWSGAVDTLGLFLSDTLGADTFKAFYTFVDTFNCEVIDSFEFIILPDLAITFSDSVFCKNENLQTLVANPPGGTWSGSGITPSGEIEPQLLAVGNHVFIYTFQRLPDSCIFSKNLTVEIQEQEPGIISGDTSFCATSGIQTFSGTPSGGTWGGVANALGEVDPTSLPPGVNQISYTYGDSVCTETIFQSITLTPLPTAMLSGGGNICAGGVTEIDLEISLTGNTPWEIVYSIDNVPQIPLTVSSSPFLLRTGQAGNYELTSVTDASGCQNTASGMATITEFSPLTISNLTTDCNVTNTGFDMQFEISGGDPASYQVSGVTGMISSTPPFIFSSQNNPPGTDITITISDGSNCPAISETIRVDCSCDTEIGSMDLSARDICIPAHAESAYDPTGQFLDGNDVFEFVLHTNSGLTLGTILQKSNTPIFSYDSGLMMPGVTYYISAIAGNDDGTGSVDLNDNCLKVSAGTPVTFYEQPEAILSGDQNICPDSTATLQVQFSGEPPFNLQYSDGMTTTDLNGIMSNPFDLNVAPNLNTTYDLISISNDFCPTGRVSGSAQISILEAPTASDITITCDPTNTSFTVQFTVTGGDAGSYNISGNTGNFSGNTFTSDPILSGQNYSFFLSDGNQCGIVPIEGSHQCSCDTDAGSFQPGNLELCEGETAMPIHNSDQFLDGDDGFIFVLHDGSTANLGTILLQNTMPSFDFDPGILVTDNEYFISAIAGNSDRSGSIDLSDPCLSVSPGIRVIWHRIPNATLEHDGPICEGDSVTLTFRFEGTGPFSFRLNYNGNDRDFTNVDDGQEVRIQLNSTTNFFIQNLSDAFCTKTTSSGASVRVIQPPSADVTASAEICNSDAFGDETVIDFSTLITGGDASGNWTDLDNSGASGSLPNLDFTGVIPGQYRFEYTTASAVSPCPEAIYEVTMTVRDCACPSVSTTAPTGDFCNTDAMLDLSDLTTTSESGTWSIFSAPSGSTATISGNIFNANNSPAGDYVLEFSLDSPVAGCSESSMQTITVYAPPTAVVLQHGEVCNSAASGNSTIFNFDDLITSGDIFGTWEDVEMSGASGSFPRLDFSGIQPNQYTFRYTTNSAQAPCVESVYEMTLTVKDCACPDVSTTAPPTPLCNDNASLDLSDLTVTTEPGSWSILSAPSGSFSTITGNIFNATNSVAGDYQLEFTLDAPVAGCPESSVQTVQVVALLSAGNALPPIEFCENFDTLISLFSSLEDEDFGGTWMNISGNAGNGFDTNNATFNSFGLPAGDYRFQYDISGGGICPDDSETVEIIIHELPIADAGPDQELTCEIREVTIGGINSSSGGNINYSWSGTTSDPSILIPNVTAPGTYILTVENSITNCVASDEVEVTLNGELPILDASSIAITCFGLGNGIIRVDDVSGGNAPYLYSLNGQPFSDKNEFTGLTPGDYTLTVEDINGCKDEVSFTISEPDEVNVELSVNLTGGSNIISLGDSALLTASISGLVDSVSWSPNEAFEPCDSTMNVANCLTQWVSPQSVTTYAVFVTNEKGCSDESELTIEVVNDLDIFMPEAFSPNNDGINDIFFVNAGARIAKVKTLAVFSRWGDQLFTVSDVPPNDPLYGWDGNFKGKKMDSGVYAFFTEVELINGTTRVFEGDLTLLR